MIQFDHIRGVDVKVMFVHVTCQLVEFSILKKN